MRKQATRLRGFVDPDWLADRISGVSPQELFLIIEAGWKNRADYHAGHIPGAIYVDLSLLEEPRTLNKIHDDQLCEVLPACGITAHAQVVLYAKDPLSAFRAAGILMYAGVKHVCVLDGGYDAWMRSGHPIEWVNEPPEPANSFGASLPIHPEYFIDTDSVKSLLADPEGVVVSLCSWAEFTGRTSGYDYIRPKGRIPGAVWSGSGSDAHHLDDYFHPNGTLKDVEQIVFRWSLAGINPEKKVAFYCGTGWRASVAFYLAHHLGWPRVSIYDGGWFAWSGNSANPTQTGIPGSGRPRWR